MHSRSHQLSRIGDSLPFLRSHGLRLKHMAIFPHPSKNLCIFMRREAVQHKNGSQACTAAIRTTDWQASDLSVAAVGSRQCSRFLGYQTRHERSSHRYAAPILPDQPRFTRCKSKASRQIAYSVCSDIHRSAMYRAYVGTSATYFLTVKKK